VSDALPEIDLHEVEATVRAAIDRGNNDGLRLLGHGEISLVLAWPTAAPHAALKRVPPFRNVAAAQQYVAVCDEFFQRLAAAGIATLPTALHVHERADGRAVVYHRQPIADAAQIGSNVLRNAPIADGHPLLDSIVDATANVCSPTVGFDVQVANWLWDGTTATQLDFTSPFMLTAGRNDLTYDSHAFLQEYPVLLRPYLKRELTTLVHRFTTPEGALGDLVGNLFKEGLDQWVDPAIATINSRAGLSLDRATARKMYDDDRKLLPLVFKLKKAQRWWLTHTGRHYESLLPAHTTYGK
jgi:hypothetical protein